VGLPGENRALERHNLDSSLLHSSDDSSQFGNQEQTTLLIPDGGFMKSPADVRWHLPRLAQKRRERNGDSMLSGQRQKCIPVKLGGDRALDQIEIAGQPGVKAAGQKKELHRSGECP
jgi:hypothetical protein